MFDLLTSPTRFLFFTGKGGVGKTSLACASAITLADSGKHVLLVSTDPASNLDQVLEVSLSSAPTAIPSVPRLWALNIDPEAAAEAYRERALGPLRGSVSDEELSRRTEELSGACTVEIAAFDEFTGLLTDDTQIADFDHIIFDTAPTGHTLRLLHLPAAWSGFIDDNPGGASCLGPHTALARQQAQFNAAVTALGDPAQTTLVLVARPDRGAMREAARTSRELQDLAMQNQHLVLNGIFVATDRRDAVAAALERRGYEALLQLPEALAKLPTSHVALQPFNLVGVETLRSLLAEHAAAGQDGADIHAPMPGDIPPLAALIDELAAARRGLILVMGKGGVGKTTLAAAVAVGLAARGHDVHLTTTDPAAHVTATLDGVVEHLRVSRIDPAAETAAYTERVLALRGRGLSPDEVELLREDLKSPCTEEVAVFHAFSRIVSEARSGFVVVDTAPTGHTLLLLDTTGAYHHEVMRSVAGQRGISGAVTPLMRIRDPQYTRILVATLPETTPVLEAAGLQADLRRAGIEPFAWVINSSLAATDTTDPLLRRRAAAEVPQIEQVQQELAERVYLVPWQADEPVGVSQLRQLTEGPFAASGVTSPKFAGAIGGNA